MSKSSILSLTVALACICFCQRHAQAQFRIVGGSTTTISTAPYIVALHISGKFYCAGTLVSNQHVVTAAHCVDGKSRGSMSVTGGSTRLSGRGVRRTVERVITPSSYNRNTRNMDVAVLKLSSPMTGDNIAVAGLCNRMMRAGEAVRVYGWGVTSENSRTNSDQLRTAQVTLVSKSSCARQYRETRLTKSMFCASVPGVRDACAGDSGGPAIHNNRLCGIVSWGMGCARPNYPGVYTNVYTIRTFIENAIKM